MSGNKVLVALGNLNLGKQTAQAIFAPYLFEHIKFAFSICRMEPSRHYETNWKVPSIFKYHFNQMEVSICMLVFCM